MKDFETQSSQVSVSGKLDPVELRPDVSAVGAFLLHTSSPERIRPSVGPVSHGGVVLRSARVFRNEGELARFAKSSGGEIEAIELPVGSARDKLLEKWVSKVKKNKKGVASILLLPLAACGGSGSNTDNATVDTPVISAVELNNLDSNTSGTVDAATVATLTGAAADVNTAYASGGISNLGDEAVTLTDTSLAASVLNTLDGNTSGTVDAATVATLTGAAADVNTAYASGGISNLGDEAVTLTDTSLAASVLNTLDGNTSGTIDATTVTTLTGAAADANTAYASGGISNLGNEAVTLTDTSLAASVLNTLDGNTSGTVDAATVATLTGAAADVNTAYASGGISNLGNEAVTLTDTSLAASVLNTLDGNTSGTIDATTVTTLTGTVADIKAAFQANENGAISGLGNESVVLTAGTALASEIQYISNQLNGGSFDLSAITNISGTFSELTNLYGNGDTMPLPANVTLSVTGPISSASIVSLDATSSSANIDVSGATLSDVTPTFTADQANSMNVSGITGVKITDASATVTYDFSGFDAGSISTVIFSSGGSISSTFITGGTLASQFEQKDATGADLSLGADFSSTASLSLNSTGQAIDLTGTVITFTTSGRSLTISGDNDITIKGLATGPGATSVSINNQLSAGSFNITGGSPAIDLDPTTSSLNVVMDGQGSMAIGSADTTAGDSDGVEGIVGSGLTSISVTYQAGAANTTGTLNLGSIDTPSTGTLANNFAVTVSNLSGGTVQDTDVQLNADVAAGNSISFDGVKLQIDDSASFGAGSSVEFQNTETTGSETALNAVPVSATSDLTVQSGKVMTFTAAEAAALTAAGGSVSGDGSVRITDLDATLGVDLSSFTPTGGVELVLTTNTTLTVAAVMPAVAYSIEGTGDLDLSSLGANLATTASFIVGDGQALTVTASQASGKTIGGDTGGSDDGGVVVTGLDGAAAYDLSSVGSGSGTVTATLASSATLNSGTDLGTTVVTVADGQTLTLSAAQADGVTIGGDGLNSDDGDVVITGATAATAYDFSNVGSTNGTVNVTVATGGTLNGTTNLGTASVTVADGQTLTLSAAQADAVTIGSSGGGTNDGSVVITAVTGSEDLTDISSGSGSISATLATGSDISSAALGNVSVLGLENDASSSMIIAQHALVTSGVGNNQIILTDAGTLSGTTFIESYQLANGVNTFTTSSNGNTVVGGNDVDNLNGAGAVDDLRGGEGDDVISAGAGADSITGGTGADNLTGGDGADIFKFVSGDTDVVSPSDIIADFSTLDGDQISIGETVGNITIADGELLVLPTFKTAATEAFDGTGADVYIAYNVSGLGDALIAVDTSGDGSFGAGDLLIKLLNVDGSDDILSGDIIA